MKINTDISVGREQGAHLTPFQPLTSLSALYKTFLWYSKGIL
jgi:hypothetical protein